MKGRIFQWRQPCYRKSLTLPKRFQQENKFADVTLAKRNNELIHAHKGVLTSVSFIKKELPAMRKTCSDRIYYMKKRLLEEEDDLKERLKVFLFNKRDVLNEISVEKVKDPSEGNVTHLKIFTKQSIK